MFLLRIFVGNVSKTCFSIATIGKPDILIVDEVLSVGDFRFQEKCEKRIQGMMKEDTTILFVSHSIDQVKRFAKGQFGSKRTYS